MLTPTLDLMRDARARQYALGAFNVYNLEGVMAVIQAAEEALSPVLLQIHPRALAHGGTPFVTLCLAAGNDSRVPVAVHLDHSTSETHIAGALAAGVQSVMADGSDLSYADNVAFTRRMAERTHTHAAVIEAELGKISGTEDGLTIADFEARMTDPAQAADFVAQTGVDMLAVCIGNVHGPYPGDPHLDFERLRQIRNAVPVPLVMHGASGLPEAAIQRAIDLGICKFNVNTEVRRAYVQALHNAPAGADLLDIMEQAVAAMRSVILEALRRFRSTGKAALP